METLQSFLLIVHVVVAILLIIVILLQPSSNDGGFVSSYGVSNSFVSARSAANFLHKFTMFLAIIFMSNTLVLGVLANKKARAGSQIEQFIDQKESKEPQVPLGE